MRQDHLDRVGGIEVAVEDGPELFFFARRTTPDVYAVTDRRAIIFGTSDIRTSCGHSANRKCDVWAP